MRSGRPRGPGKAFKNVGGFGPPSGAGWTAKPEPRTWLHMTRIFSAIVSKNFGCFILHCSPCRISCAPSIILAERERHLASAITHHLCRRRLAVSYTWGILGSTSAAPCIPQVHLQLKNDSVPKLSAARPQVIADGKVPSLSVLKVSRRQLWFGRPLGATSSTGLRMRLYLINLFSAPLGGEFSLEGAW